MKRRPVIAMLLPLLLTACAHGGAAQRNLSVEVLPSSTPPMLQVYDVRSGALITMDAETYTAGVVAGEMPGTWPIEALKAQAILARTFVMKFITEKESRYPGADISTDIAEAQAYDAAAVNGRILQAVQETEGLILLGEDDSLPYTWFHAHSGGQTALARESLDWQGTEPGYTASLPGGDSPDAPESAKAWAAEFTAEAFLQACREAGAQPPHCRTVTIGEQGSSGRAVTLLCGGAEVNAARLRIALGSTVMRSTLLTELVSDGETVRMAGLGYGHGVGMPQWGAYGMAQAGHTGEEIALHYYRNLRLVRAW